MAENNYTSVLPVVKSSLIHFPRILFFLKQDRTHKSDRLNNHADEKTQMYC